MAKMDPEEVRRRLEQEALDEEIARKLDADPDFAKDFDDSFVILFKGMEDDIIGQRAKAAGFSDEEIQKALRDAQKIRKVAKGGFLTNGDPKKADEMIREHKVLKKVAKTESEKSCFFAALVILSGSGTIAIGAIWAAAELLSRVLA